MNINAHDAEPDGSSKGRDLLNEILKTGGTSEMIADIAILYQDRLTEFSKKKLARYPGLRGKISPSEIVQTVLAGLGKSSNYEEVRRATAVLFTKANDQIRAGNSYFSRGKRDPKREIPGDVDVAVPDSRTPTPLDLAIANEHARVFEILSKQEMRILIMQDYFEIPFETIAAELGLPLKKVEKFYTGAKRKMAEQLGLGGSA